VFNIRMRNFYIVIAGGIQICICGIPYQLLMLYFVSSSVLLLFDVIFLVLMVESVILFLTRTFQNSYL